MAPIKGAAAYKKKDGTLAISPDQQSVQWLAHGSDKAVAIPVASITSMFMVMVVYLPIQSDSRGPG